MLWFKKISLIFVFLFAGNFLFAGLNTLQGEAKFIASDNKKYKNVNIDTSKWKTVKIPEDLYSSQGIKRGIFWYRIKLDTKTLSENFPAHVYFSGITGKYTIYLNGKMLSKGSGLFSTTNKIEIPSNVIKKNGKNILAIRINNDIFIGASGIYNKVYIAPADELTAFVSKRQTVFIVIFMIIFVFSLIFLFTFKKNLKNYSAFYLSGALLIAGLFIFFQSNIGMKLFENAFVYFKILAIIKIVFCVLIVLFLNRFYKTGVNKLDSVFFSLTGIITIFVIFLSNAQVIIYFESAFIIILLIPVFYYSMILIKNMIKLNVPAYFFFTGIFISVLYTFIIFFVEQPNYYLKIFHVAYTSMAFSAGYFSFYFSKFNEIFESKFILENRLMESSIIVEDKNQSYLDLNEHMQMNQSSLINAIEISKTINESISYEIPELSEAKFDLILKTNKDFSGDVLRFIELKNGLRVFIIDFPGDEISTTFFNVITELEIRNMLKTKSPAAILNKLNEVFIQYDFHSFFTATIIDFDFEEKKIKYVNAGAPHVFIIRQNSFDVLENGGTVIGLDHEKYKDNKKTLQTGDRIILFTDGLMHLVRKIYETTFDDYIFSLEPQEIYAKLEQCITQHPDKMLDDIVLMKFDI